MGGVYVIPYAKTNIGTKMIYFKDNVGSLFIKNDSLLREILDLARFLFYLFISNKTELAGSE
jgi:hypothetical protein